MRGVLDKLYPLRHAQVMAVFDGNEAPHPPRRRSARPGRSRCTVIAMRDQAIS
jgi:hypothetical protein